MHPADDDALNTEERIWDLTMQINLKGVWWGCKYAILAMRNNPTDESKGLHAGGSIINTASFVALMGAATPQLACTLVTIDCSAEFRSFDELCGSIRYRVEGVKKLQPFISFISDTSAGWRPCDDQGTSDGSCQGRNSR